MIEKLVDLYNEFVAAVESREEYKMQIKRARDLLEKIRQLFRYDDISPTEILVPVEISCHEQAHKRHALSVIDLSVFYKTQDEDIWHWGYSCGRSPIDTLETICKYAPDLLDAVRKFRESEKAKTEKVRKFLDAIEDALKPILIAREIKG